MNYTVKNELYGFFTDLMDSYGFCSQSLQVWSTQGWQVCLCPGTTANIGDNLLPSLTVFGCSAVEVDTGPLSDVVFPYFLLPSSFPSPWYCCFLYDLDGVASQLYGDSKLINPFEPTRFPPKFAPGTAIFQGLHFFVRWHEEFLITAW